MAIKDWPGGVISKTPVVPAGTYADSAASGVWTLDQVAYWQKRGIWPNPANVVDPYYEYVSLLLTGDGTNGAQNNTFLDSSTNNFTITRNGNTTQGTFSPYGANWSNYLNGSDSVIYKTYQEITTGPFTIEAWIYPTIDFTSTYMSILGNGGWKSGNNRGCSLSLLGDGTRKLSLGASDGTWNTFPAILNSASAIPSNQWTHVAVTRDSSNVVRMFINGVVNASTTYSASLALYSEGTYSQYTSPFTAIGGWYSDNQWQSDFFGYISNFRLSINTAFYTANFTPSTTPLTNISGTTLLTCQSNRFIDNSSNNYALSIGGTPSVQRFSPFNPTAPYSASTIGGSGYFDGSGDYLSVGSAANWTFLNNGSDWTVEFDVFHSSTSQLVVVSTTITTAQVGSSISLNNPANAVYVEIDRGVAGSSAAFTSSAYLQINQWNHVAVTFANSGKTCSFYINGVAAGSSSNTGFAYSSSNPSNTLSVGTTYGGYLANLRISDNVRTGLTTLPTAPYTSDANTKLLCNFTNAGIYDSAMMNDLETVGNAQVSTSVVKYGTGSLAFDGTGDYLSAPTSPNLGIGSGDFTIEFWLYANTVSGYQTVLDLRTSQPSAGPSIYFADNSRLNYLFNSGTAYAFGPNPLSANTWYHVAWVRSGTTHTLYVDGQSQATFTDSAGLTSSPLAIGARQAGGYADYFNGYIDDLRITKGYARYTANFTPPTQAFPIY